MRLKPMVGNIHALLGVRPGHLDHQKTISVQYWAEAHFSQRTIRTKQVSNNTALRFIGRCEDLFEVTFGVLPDAIFDHGVLRSDEHTSELQSLMRLSYTVFCLKLKQ